MGCKLYSCVLLIWVNGVWVGIWWIFVCGDMELLYDVGWKQLDVGCLLLLLLLFGVGDVLLCGECVNYYFDNLLFDSDVIWCWFVLWFGMVMIELFDLFVVFGWDCVGVVQLFGEDEILVGYDWIDGMLLFDDDVVYVFDQVSGVVGGVQDDDDFCLLLVGVQEKIVLLFYDG